MEEIKNSNCRCGKCSEILKIWWVKSLIGFLLFLLIFWLGALFGRGQNHGGRGFANPSCFSRRWERTQGWEPAQEQQSAPAASQAPTGAINGQPTTPPTGTIVTPNAPTNPAAPAASETK